MPIIDLKHVLIYIEDGTTLTGAINNVSGYAPGATTILVNNIVGIAPVGARLALGTSTPDDRYTITAHAETSGNTTSITFTPALVESLANGDAVAVHGVFLKIHVGDGTLTWDEKRPRDYKKDRGLLYQVRDGDQEPMDVSFNLLYEQITASTGDPPSFEDALKQRGMASTWISAETTDPCAPYAVNLRLDNFQQPGCTAVQAERVILPNFRYESLNHNPKDGTIACQGKCNAQQAIVTRFANYNQDTGPGG